jgi:hypothetical protein
LPEVVTTTGRHKNGQPVSVKISVRALVEPGGRITEVEAFMHAG